MLGRIDIITYYYEPEKTPRAYRAAELAKEFSRRGYEVRVITPMQAGVKSEGTSNLKIDYVHPGYLFHRQKVVAASSAKQTGSAAGKWMVRTVKVVAGLLVWPADRTFEWQLRVLALYKRENPVPPIAIISIGLPVSAHAAAIRVKHWYKQNPNIIFIADYGDPYSLNPVFNTTRLDRKKEGRLLRQFHYLTLPVQAAIPAFTALGVSAGSIRIIPQGFERIPVKDSNQKYDLYTGVYGGRFYAGIREPGPLFKATALANRMGKKVQLLVYTEPDSVLVQEALNNLEEGDRLNIHIQPLLDRSAYIQEMRRAHFAVNLLNESAFQVPSKQLDFAEAEVPVLLVEPKQTPEEIARMIAEEVFTSYSAEDMHDIKHVADSFLELIEPVKNKAGSNHA
jgi:hypothetical protein